jgi:hypothetical protein
MANQGEKIPQPYPQIVPAPKAQQSYDVNDVDTPNNPTMLDQIRGDNLSQKPNTSYGRSCVA